MDLLKPHQLQSTGFKVGRLKYAKYCLEQKNYCKNTLKKAYFFIELMLNKTPDAVLGRAANSVALVFCY